MGDNNFVDNLLDSSIYYCKTVKFQENSTDTNSFIKLSILRRLTCQLGKISYLVADNQVSCDLLNENLKNYSDLVDDKNGANNYAESIQALVKYLKNAQCQRWKSGLRADCDETICNELSLAVENYNCNECEDPNENIDLFQKTCKNLDKIHPNFASMTKQDPVSGDHNSILKSSSNFNQKRKNCFPVFEQPDFSKARKFDESGCLNKLSNTDKSPLFIAPGNKFKNEASLQQESPNNGKAVTRPSANFRTASAELRAQQQKKYGNGRDKANECGNDSGQLHLKKSLGSRPRPVHSKFIAPVKSNDKNGMSYNENCESAENSQEDCDPRLRHIDPKMIEMIRGEIMDSTNPVTWDDIAGLQFAKNTIQEIVVWPMLRPDIFTGLRRPPKGILLFGPPGTGKTLIAKCIASQSKSTFFSISASSLTSKWIGDGEKMVRALFAVARVDQPSVVFIDEIDSLLSKRSDTEHESSRRIKTEFLVQLDGATTGEEDRLLIIGATNRPQELDEAARRRLVKRLYIPLPELQARIEMITRLLSKERNNLTSEQISELALLTDGYSGADVKILCQEAALGPIRSISYSQIEHITTEQVRPVTMDDFKTALTRVRSSVSSGDLQCYIDWDKTYGSGAI